MRVEYTRQFQDHLKEAPLKIQIAFSNRLEMFKENQFHPLLNNHVLKGSYDGCHSINITGDWRAVYENVKDQGLISFVMLGTHSQLYK
ncbi:MAG: type II toxin-antitoxin system mRNA interferase toxin, RelE/StbE family [Candidatus Magasanikbacteria bacterium]